MRYTHAVVVPSLFCAALHGAQAQDKIPIRTVTAPLATTAGTLGSILGVRQSANGNVVVNDGRRRQLLVFDSTLTRFTVALDSAEGASNYYGRGSVPLVPFVGDSSLMLDMGAQAFLLIDGNGKVVRAVAPPNASDLVPIGLNGIGADQSGRMLYRGRGGAPPPPPGSPPPVIDLARPDSGTILRANFATRTVDTLAVVYSWPAARVTTALAEDGRTQGTINQNPLTRRDEVVLLSDGSLAIVRVHDYHIDWVRPDGRKESSAKMPFDWRRLTDADKQNLLDSARTAREAQQAAMATAAAGRGNAADVAGAGGRGVAVAGGGMRGGAASADGRPPLPLKALDYPLSAIPDYVPPIRQGTARADADGNVWLLPTTTTRSTGGELVYDVVNSRGELFERVRLPVGRTIAGFGKGGTIYLQAGSFATGFTLERVKVVRDGRANH